MVFSSPTFLFVFLPLTLLGYLAVPARWRNGWLLLASILFYVWGAGAELGIMLFVALVSFFGALIGWRAARQADASGEVPKWAVISLIALLLVPIIAFKYLPPVQQFAADRGWSEVFGLNPITWALPLGISFFTFHAISYVVDVARRDLRPERSVRDYLLYLFLFPHQIAGPIVRYSEIRDELKGRRDVTLEQSVYGASRFSWGLAKKACIADPAGLVANAAFASADGDMTAPTAWLAAFAYTVQIYFDFSGYSDMAIGLAMMFGFHFPENFNSPYKAVSITDFWRRWHMTLSRWFRDYVYIPLGGNRYGAGREYGALLITFFLTSLWHGATWTFLVWGGLHSLFLVLERLTGLRKVRRLVVLRRALTFALIVVLWVPFRATTMTQAVDIWQGMFTGGFGGLPPEVLITLTPFPLIAMAIALIVVVGPSSRTTFQWVFGAVSTLSLNRFRFGFALATVPVLMTAAVIAILWTDFSPFLYFQF
jgi:alginate O-acetyltransferase complex protein AlgI